MYYNLKNILDTKEKRIKLYTLLSIDNTRLSKKINGSYSKKNFTDIEKSIIYNYITEELHKDISYEELFSWQKKELKLPSKYNDTIPKRIRICIERIKYLTSLENNTITENDIAEKLNISIGTLRNYKNGVSDISYTFIKEKLSWVLNVIPQYILGEYDIPMSRIYENHINIWNTTNNQLNLIQNTITEIILDKFSIKDKDDFKDFMNTDFTDYYYDLELEIASTYLRISEEEAQKLIYKTVEDKEMDLYIYDMELDMWQNKLWLINNDYNDINEGEAHYKWMVKRIEEINKEIDKIEKEVAI